MAKVEIVSEQEVRWRAAGELSDDPVVSPTLYHPPIYMVGT